MLTAVNAHNRNQDSLGEMTFVEHLGEIRRRLVFCIAAFAVSSIVTYVFYGSVLKLFERPYCETLPAHHACALYITGPLDGFAIRMNITGYGGLLLASPVILYQLWRFVTPGLRANEKRYAFPFVIATFSLFTLGAFVAWTTFPHALTFLHAVGGPGIEDLFSPQKYLSLILALMAIFGVAFEFPAVLVGLELAHVITPSQLSKWRRGAILAIVVISAVVTPSSDPFSMLAMALPMLMFYEISILLGRILGRRPTVAI